MDVDQLAKLFVYQRIVKESTAKCSPFQYEKVISAISVHFSHLNYAYNHFFPICDMFNYISFKV